MIPRYEESPTLRPPTARRRRKLGGLGWSRWGSAAATALASACAGRATGPAAPVLPTAADVTRSMTALVTPFPAGAPAPPTRAALVAALDSVLAAPEWSTAHWGVLIVDPATGDTLYSHNADKLFLPASNQKLITGTVALARLGPEYRWRTVLATPTSAVARLRRGTLPGDLYILGTGDPSVSDAMQHGDAMGPLRHLADSLWARGVRRIGGRVLAAPGGPEGRFPDGPWKFGWEWDDFDTPSGAGATELLFNEGVARVVVTGAARAGASARVAVRPTQGSLPLDTSAPPIRTVAAADTAGHPVEAIWDYAANAYTLRGAVTPGDSVVLELGIHDPRRAYAAALGDALTARGIVVEGRSVQGRTVEGQAAGPSPAGGLDTLASLTSPPLRDVLPALEKPSQNQMAELLYLTLGREGSGVGSGDSARRVVGDQLRAWGVEPERDAVVRDGSGLSRHDFVTPTALVRVLDAARRLPTFAVFYDALPVMGVDGTLAGRLRGTAAEGRIHAKTGTVDRARNLSGYALTADGVPLLFALLCNNYTVPTAAVTRAQDTIALRLATLRLGTDRAPTSRAATR